MNKKQDANTNNCVSLVNSVEKEEIDRLKNLSGKIYDIVIVGAGIGGMFCALNLDPNYKILLISKKSLKDCNSYLAQGGMCVLKSDNDFDLYMEDTLNAGHYENRIESVKAMILRSKEVLLKLLEIKVPLDLSEGTVEPMQGEILIEPDEDIKHLSFTKEGGHRVRRIVHAKDETGKAIVEKLIDQVKSNENIDIYENMEMIDLLIKDNKCYGLVIKDTEDCSKDFHVAKIFSQKLVLATGGIGGLYENSTNFSHIKGDSIGILKNYHGEMENLNYIQIHPTTLYYKKDDRKRLLTEALRGEGAYILNQAGERFVDELKPRDIVSNAIFDQMAKEGSSHVYLSLKHLDKDMVRERFPYIYKMCKDRGLDLNEDNIPIVPSQHYHMGGIYVDQRSMTSVENLYAVGECACNGVHGANRLASNSLLESMVFSMVIAQDIKNQKVFAGDFANLQALDFKDRDWARYMRDNREGLKEKIEANDLYRSNKSSKINDYSKNTKLYEKNPSKSKNKDKKAELDKKII